MTRRELGRVSTPGRGGRDASVVVYACDVLGCVLALDVGPSGELLVAVLEPDTAAHLAGLLAGWAGVEQ